MIKKTFLSFLALLISQNAYSLSLELFEPVVDNLGTIRIQGTKTLEKHQFSLGVFESYMSEPLRITGYSTAPTTRQVVGRMYTTNLLGEVGIFDWLSVGIQLPFMNTSRVVPETLNTANPVNTTHWDMGDIRIHSKISTFSQEEGFPIGIAAIPFIELPSGNDLDYTGDKNASLGAHFNFDWEYERVYLVANIGVKGRFESEQLSFAGISQTLDVGTEFLYGFGGRVDVIQDRLQVLADIVGSTPFAHFGQYERSSPVEMMGGLRAFFKDRMIGVHVGAGSGLDHGYGAAKFRIYGGLTFQHPGTKKQVAVPEREFQLLTVEKKRTIILKGVYFETAKSDLKPESYVSLDENVKMLKDNPDVEVLIEGHTDDRGSEEYNKKLSEGRANSVKDYFIAHGIDASRISAAGMGESHPLVPNDSDENMAKNRRIEMHIMVISKTETVVDEKGKPVEIEKKKVKEEK